MKRLMFIGLYLLFSMTGTRGQTFPPFINYLNSLPEAQRQAVVDSFMAVPRDYPFTECDSFAHFIYQGTAGSVTVAGDANVWDPAATPLNLMAGTNFWYLTQVFFPDARLDYKFVLNGSNWVLDPLNPHTCSGGFGPNSELAMPLYIPAPEILYYPDIPHGTLRDTTFYCPALANYRTVRVYLPPGYATSGQSYGMVLFHDGLEYVSLAQANNVLDYLIHTQDITPVIAVFVPPVNRTPEYAGSQMGAFTDFIVNTIVPWVDARYRTRPAPKYRATLGASYGGNISLWLGMTHPEVFGNVATQSAYIQPSISSTFENGPVLPLELYMDLGTYDIPELIPMGRAFEQILWNKGYSFIYYEYDEGHSWGSWRAHIDNALEDFFPFWSGTEETPGEDRAFLGNCCPNPAGDEVSVTYRVPAGVPVTITLAAMDGRIVRTLFDGKSSEKETSLRFSLAGLSPGAYLVTLTAGGQKTTRKVMKTGSQTKKD